MNNFGVGDTEKAFNFGTGCVTFNSSELGDNSYFTIATKIVGPACVNAGIQAWLRADYGASGSLWNDFSGNNNSFSQSVEGEKPALLAGSAQTNFNPTFNFAAGDNFEKTVGLLNSAGGTVIAAVSNSNLASTWADIYNQNIDDPTFGKWAGLSNIKMWDNGVYANTTPQQYIQNQNHIAAFDYTNTANSYTTYLDGISYNVPHGAAPSPEAGIGYIGGENTGETWLGNIYEVIFYNRELTTDELERVNSYLSLKYGVTYNNGTSDYVSYDGATEVIMWDASDNAGYNFNIAGLGREDCTDLNQKQSRSVNAGEILTVALGNTIEATNAANANTINTDRSFLVWGNNNGLNEFTTQVTGTNVTAVLGRAWRVDKTNWTDQNITLCFDNYNDDDYLVISNTSATFATINQEKQLSSLGCVTFSSTDLPDGAYFSLGKNIMAPGCVTGGIVTWLDAQTVASGNMIDGVGWADQSGNSKYFNWVFGDPARTDAALNYNHVINFDGNDYLRSTQSPFVNNFTAGEVLVVTKSGGQFAGQGNPYDFGSGNRNEHYSWSNSYVYNAFGTTDSYVYNPENNVVGDNKAGAPNPAVGNFYTETNWNLYHTYSAPNDWGTGFNGLFKATTTTNTVSFALTANNEHIGSNGSSHVYTGDIAEVVLYRRKLTAAERQKVMSYLALKYGMTLDTTVTDQDYVAADGTIFWDWSDNNNYQHDIAGIGRDDCQKLNQKQSKSINGDDPLAMAVGNFNTFPLSNEANTTTITNDKSFLVWSNNNGALTFTTPVPKLGINGTFHTTRKWKIDKTNFADQLLTISVGQSGERYLLVDEDGSGGFENDANTKEYAFNFTTGLLNINSSALPDGAVIALGTKIAGPGCVNAGIRGWFRADYGASATQWSDFSGNSLNTTATGAGNDPAVTQVINFNPAVNFDGNDVFTANIVGGFSGNQSYTIFSVFSPANTSGQNLFAIGTPATRQNVAYHPSVSGNRLLYHFNDDLTGTGTLAGWQLGGFQYDNSLAGNDRFMYSNGALIAQNNAGTLNVPVNPLMSIGGYSNRTGANGDELVGDIAEFVVYNTVLTAAQRQQVESYFALKYGITLNNGTTDYLASDGSTVYWDATTNAGYGNDIAGIGLDICTELRQKQSKSVNTDAILTGALGIAVEASNAANATAFSDADLSFLVWGNNDSNLDFDNTVTATGTTSMAYLGRVWRAQKTNFSNQSITLCFDGYSDDTYLLISNASSTFATVNQEKQLNANGCVTFMSDDLTDGAYFTLGKNLVGPACVDGGIKLWLRADDGLTDTIGTVSQWDDVSGNGHSFVKNGANPLPLYETTNPKFNFNPSLNFDAGAGTEELRDDSVGDLISPTAQDNYSMFAAMVKVGNNDRLFTTQNTGANYYALDVNQGGRSSASIEYQNPVALSNNETKLVGITYDGTAPNRRGYHNGKLTIDPAVSASTINSIAAGAAEIGPANGNGDFNGQVAEIIVYNRQVSLVEAQMINSYLALKYGVTLDQITATDYLASDGTTMWDASDNAGYGNDIAGIGKDDCTNLNQKQSKSVNSDALITMALGTSKEATNQDNPNTITNDKSFLVWSNDNGSTSFATAFTKTGSTINLRTARIWKVDKTNWADQDITICVGQTGERSLIIDNGLDADFADDSETSVHALDFSTGCVTINSSLLPDGAHFSLGTEIKGPACVDAGIKTWFRADYGASVGAWNDYSGNSNNTVQATVANQPALSSSVINFNPAFDFTNDDYLRDANGIFGGATYTSSNVFVVQISDAVQAQSIFYENTSLNYFNAHIPWSDGNLYWDPPVTSNRVFTAWGGTVGTPYLWSLTSNTAGTGVTTGRYIHRNRAQIGGSSTAPAAFTGLNAPFNIGRTETNVWYANAKIAELVVYGGQITNIERQKIESYLALKYGITLDQTTPTNYVASNWDGMTGTIIWDATTNAGYHNNIAGIGRDSCTNLVQKQSKSVNADAIVTVALGSTIEVSNAANTGTITADRSFFVWGHNSGAEDFLADAGGTNATARLDRVWKVQKTNWTDQTITMKFDGYDDEAYLIIHATDPTFLSTPLEYQLNINGEVTLNTSDLANGAFFTIGKNLRGPACVDGGIKVWLRADQGVTTSGTEVTNWTDYSNNGNTPTTVSTPDLVTNSINFNPGVSFEGITTDEYFDFGTLTNGYTAAQAFVVTFQDNADITNNNETGLWRIGGNSNTHNVLTNELLYESFGNNARIDAVTTPDSDIPHLYSASQSSGNQANLYWNAANIHSSMRTTLFPNEPVWLGKNRLNNRYQGDVVEFILYNKVLSATEQQTVSSYLALKYGITIDQTSPTDYLASDGTTLMWENDSDGFIHDIAGIGKDECTSLEQKQSKSVNSDDVVTFAVGAHATILTTNVDNTSPITNDLSFFSWANNNGNTNVFSTAVTAINAELRMARIWKVDKFNWQDQDVTICFDGQIGERYVLIDNDNAGLASIDKEIPLDPLTGCATFNSSELAHGTYFSLGTKILAPGCADNTDILTWLRADYGATTSQWNDFSGRTTHATQATSGDQPDTGSFMNFNPALDFDGGDFMTLSGLDINYTVTDRNPITILSVYQPDVTDRGIWGNENGGNDRALYTHQVANGAGNTAYSGGNSINQSTLVTTIMKENNPNNSFVFANGQRVLTFSQSGSGGGTTGTFLGDDDGTGAANTAFDGRIAEFAVYRGALTAAQRQQAESYLAIKYGLTLSNDNDGNTTTFEAPNANGIHEGDYIASDGTTVIWDASANSAYHNDVAGIGRDTCTALNQKQSRSANSDDIVTMALGSAVEATNAANTNTFTNDRGFLVWGNNDGNTTFNTAQTGMFVNARLGRIWKVQKTTNWDDTQDVTLCFDGFDDGNYLLISGNNTFGALDVEQQLDASGCTTINSAVLENGDFFTLGALVAGPACVNPGIVMWLRADAGITDGTAWNDQSGNDVNATQGTMSSEPTLTAGAINFNPGLVFDGSDDFMTLAPLNGLPYGASNRTIVTVGYSSNIVGNRWIVSYGNNTTSQANFWGQQGTTGNYGGFNNDLTSASYWTSNVPILTANTYNGTAATIYKNGAAPVTLNRTWNTVQNKGYIGRQVNDAEYWQGGIGEVIIYDRVLNTTELQQVNSYLALKYGISLDQTTPQDYIASDGSTLMWEAVANGVYKNDIAGIGLDECTGLNQKQSKSSSTDAVITMGLGSIEADNASNSNTFAANLSFMTWANDNGALSEITTDLPAQFTVNAKRLAREWKVDETNGVGAVQVRANLNVPPLAGAISGTVASEIRLLIDRDGDGDFTTGIVDVVTASSYSGGIATFDNIDFQDGDVFTIGTKLPDVTLSVKVLLQGPAIGATAGMMRNDLQTYGPPLAMPTTDPYLGTSTYNDINDPMGVVGAVTDWVLVQIRSAATPSIILQQKALLVQTDGDVVDETGAAPKFTPQANAVYVVVLHRNHLGIMSNVINTFQDVVSYNFTTALGQAYKEDPGDPDPMIQVNGFWTMWAGDKNMDGVIDNLDLTDVKQDFNLFLFEDYFLTDVNMDSVVDNLDLTLTKIVKSKPKDAKKLCLSFFQGF